MTVALQLPTPSSELHWESIDGTEATTFRSNSTYKIILERTENFSGHCSLDPYCDNNYSGKFWFEGEKLFYNHSSLGWTDYWSTWSVQEGLLHLDEDVYENSRFPGLLTHQ